MPSVVSAFTYLAASKLGDDSAQDRARVEAVARIQVLRARRYSGDDAVQKGAEHDLVAWFAGGDLVSESAVGVDRRVLENVEHVGDLPLLVLPRCQCLKEVAAAAPMVLDP